MKTDDRKTLESRADSGKAASALVNQMLRPFDELIELDLLHGTMQNLHHVDGKYFVPIFDDTVEDIHGYSIENMVHPDDREAYLRESDPKTLARRMAASETPGELRFRLRYKLLDGGWRWVEQVVMDGSLYGQPKGIYYVFVFDVEDQMGPEPASSTGERSALTGLLR